MRVGASRIPSVGMLLASSATRRTGTWRCSSGGPIALASPSAIGRAPRPRRSRRRLETIFAYCGSYEFGDGEVRHRVEMSLMPNWIGGEQVRLVAFDGDRITLSTPPTLIDGRQQIATLVWQRA